jgi:hypothetical protein
MTAPQRTNPLTFSKKDWRIMSARLILAHLDEDEESKVWYRDLVRDQCGIDPVHFHLADDLAKLYAAEYTTPEAKAKARDTLQTRLEKIL